MRADNVSLILCYILRDLHRLGHSEHSECIEQINKLVITFVISSYSNDNN